MPDPTDRQWDYLLDLQKKKGRDPFYNAVEQIRGRGVRNTKGMTKAEASAVIQILAGRKDW